MENKVIKCGLYARVSTHHQLENEYNSIESQIEKLRAYCDVHNYDIYNVYEDGGFSGSTLDRPQLQALIRDIVCKNVNCVIVYKIDRLTRSMKDFYELAGLFEEYNVSFISISQDFDTTNSMGRLNLNILLSFGQFEREMIADRIRDKMRQRARRGLFNGRQIPFGYKSINKQLVIDEETAHIVQFMFETYAENPSITYVREQLHLRGWFNSKGKKWGKPVLSHMLKNKVYVGLVKCNDKYYDGVHEPIISRDLFEKVQSIKPNRKHVRTRMKRVYPLKGLLRCQDCGSYLTPYYTQKKKPDGSIVRIPYYRCTRTNHHDYSDCSIKYVNADKLENNIFNLLLNISSDHSLIDNAVSNLNKDLSKSAKPLIQDEKQLQKRISELEMEIENFINALGKGTLPIERIENAIQEREEEIKRIKIEQHSIQQKIQEATFEEFDAEILKSKLNDFNEIFDVLTEKEKSEFLQCMVKTIEVHPDKYVLNMYELKNDFPGSKNRSIWWS